MKHARMSLVAALLLGATHVAAAQGAVDTDAQTVTLTVSTVQTIAFSTASFTIPVTELNTDVVDNTSTTYAVTDNSGTSMKITGSYDVATTGLTLKLLLQTPGAGSATERTLTTGEQDLVTGFASVSVTGRTVTYTARATAEVTPTSYAKVVTLTLIAA